MNVRILHEQTKQERVGRFECFVASTNHVSLHFGVMIGSREFSYNTGYGHALATSKEAPIREWKIHPEDLETLRSMAREKGRKVKPCGKSTGRPRKPKRGPNPHPRQLSFGDPK